MSGIKVNFYESVSDGSLKYAVIAARYNGKWVWCRHRERATFEIPGGHREAGENISDTARRELYEETGAVRYDIFPVCVYSVDRDGTETFGMLYFSEIYELEAELHSEIECIRLFDDLPEELTYPDIQPFLFDKVRSFPAVKGGLELAKMQDMQRALQKNIMINGAGYLPKRLVTSFSGFTASLERRLMLSRKTEAEKLCPMKHCADILLRKCATL